MLPATDYSTDDGFSYGVYGVLFLYGREGPGPGRPYRFSFDGQFYETLKGYHDHYLHVDVPGIVGTNLRVEAEIGAEAWDEATYFGGGNSTLILESLPADFYTYGMDSLRASLSLRVPWREPWEILIAWSGRKARITASDHLVQIMSPAGLEGGFHSQLTTGVLVDTRDQEASPTRGMFSEASIRGAHPLWGSRWSAAGFNLTDRRFIPLDDDARLILASRVILDGHLGQVPFFEEATLGGSNPVQVGGSDSLRGLPTGRYRGDLALLLDPELRWRFWSPHPFGRDLDLMLVPFVGLGRVWSFDDAGNAPLLHFHPTGGAGFRFAWNRDFVVRFDGAAGLEEYAADGSDPLAPERGHLGAVTGFYVMVDHPY